MVLGVAFVSINAGQAVGDGAIKIEVVSGFTIEDIIQDLHNNANITVNSTPLEEVSQYLVQFSSKTVENSTVEFFLESHPGAIVLHDEK